MKFLTASTAVLLTLRTAIKRNSVHHKLWADPIRIFKSNWITTLEGFKEIIKKLTSAAINAVITRNFSQDPLETFFGAVRSTRLEIIILHVLDSSHHLKRYSLII
jgi:hypothetical protein